MRLTDISVRALKGTADYTTFFDDTLPAFGVRAGIRKKTFVIVQGKKRQRTTIGHFPAMSVADARKKAKQLLGNEPVARTAPKNFRDTADQFEKENYADSTSDWPRNVKSILANHFKSLDHKKLTEIDDDDLNDVFDGIEGKSARLHAFRVARAFFRWCTRPPRRYLKHSPMEGYEAPGKDGKRSRTLTDDELKAVWNASGEGSRRIFRLIMLWGTRSKETAILARRWAKAVDGTKDTVLVIPGFEDGQRVTKNGRDHAIPLLPLAAEQLSLAGDYYFPGRYGLDRPIRAGSLAKLRHDVQEDSGTTGWRAHDLRRTFRTNMARFGVPKDIAEILINHAPAELNEIYDRWSYLPEKKEALAKYEAFIQTLIRSGNT